MNAARFTQLRCTFISFLAILVVFTENVNVATAQESNLSEGASDATGDVAPRNIAPNPNNEELSHSTTRSIHPAIPPEQINVPRLPPMRAVRQLSDSEDLKDMLKELISTKVPVLFQTMMMVENGAATGFVGSMNTVNGLLGNTIDSQQLYLKLLDTADATGAQRYQYLQSVIESQKEANKGVWPAALMYATGDTFKKDDELKLESYNKNVDGGSSSKDLTTHSSGTTGVGSTAPTVGATGTDSTSSAGNKSFKLLEEIFTPRDGEDAIASFLRDQKDAWRMWVGDFSAETKHENEEVGVLEQKEVYIAATQLGSNDKECLNIYNYHMHKVRADVWENINEVMRSYCLFKRGNTNYSKDIFEKTRAEERIPEEAWRKVQSPDVKVTINLIDQFFKLMLTRKPLDELNCDEFKGKNTMPIPAGKKCEDVSFTNDSQENRPTNNQSFDDCAGNNGQTCLRNVLLYKITKFIAASKVNRYYSDLWYAGMQRVTQPHEGYWLTRLTCAQLGLAQRVGENHVVGVCEAGEELDRRADENFEDWIVFSNRLSKMAQGQGGSSIFRPAENNLSNFSAGAAGVGGPQQ